MSCGKLEGFPKFSNQIIFNSRRNNTDINADILKAARGGALKI